MRISCVQVYRITAHLDIAAFSAHAARSLSSISAISSWRRSIQGALLAAFLRDFFKSPPAGIERDFFSRQRLKRGAAFAPQPRP
jgi:hypothetical protein